MLAVPAGKITGKAAARLPPVRVNVTLNIRTRLGGDCIQADMLTIGDRRQSLLSQRWCAQYVAEAGVDRHDYRLPSTTLSASGVINTVTEDWPAGIVTAKAVPPIPTQSKLLAVPLCWQIKMSEAPVACPREGESTSR
jgi:hypothetical protein